MEKAGAEEAGPLGRGELGKGEGEMREAAAPVAAREVRPEPADPPAYPLGTLPGEAGEEGRKERERARDRAVADGMAAARGQAPPTLPAP